MNSVNGLLTINGVANNTLYGATDGQSQFNIVIKGDGLQLNEGTIILIQNGEFSYQKDGDVVNAFITVHTSNIVVLNGIAAGNQKVNILVAGGITQDVTERNGFRNTSIANKIGYRDTEQTLYFNMSIHGSNKVPIQKGNQIIVAGTVRLPVGQDGKMYTPEIQVYSINYQQGAKRNDQQNGQQQAPQGQGGYQAPQQPGMPPLPGQ